MNKLVNKSIPELNELLVNKQVSAKEIVQAQLDHINVVEPHINAFNIITSDLAFEQAKSIDKKISSGEKLSPLAGTTIAIKDNICLKDYPATCSSKILSNFKPPYNATVIERLIEADAIIIGKTNMDEFAMGSSCENSAFKETYNPWDINCVPGGSSGGSAAAVSAYCSTVALGSDTGGSIRQPASLCGVFGMKPTYGLVSRYGLIAYASSLDQIGPFARSVEDTALVLNTIAGHCAKDSTSYSGKFEMKDIKSQTKNVKVGLISELIGEGIDEDVRKAVLQAKSSLEQLGIKVEETSLPTLKYSLPVYYLLATAEASSNLARYDGVKYGLRVSNSDELMSMYLKTREAGFGAEVKRRIMLGTFALSSGYYDAYYKKAQQVRQMIVNEFDKVFKKFDILICPTSPSVAFARGEKTEDPLTMYLSDIATIPANLAGLPGISIPCGFGKNNLPIGLQLLAGPLKEEKLFNLAFLFEKIMANDKKPVPTVLKSLFPN
jgi:aspartyl-tRNA(Asn)/glutamyl-tRNA(Gln) amidotransferase subunit A